MIVYFADRDLAILGMASTSLPEGFVLTNDNKIEDIDTGVASFEFEINFRDDDILKAKDLAKEGNYVLRQSGDQYEAYTIIEVEINTLSQTIYCYAEDGGLDLLNGVALPEAATEAHPAAWYITEWLNYQNSGFEIGINEISSLSRKLIWEGESTITERIRSVATQFDNAEISYSFKIDGFRITKKYVNIFKKRGKDVAQELRLGREVGNIIEHRSIANLATGYYAKGGTPEPTDSNPNPQPITLRGFSYDDGDFYTNDVYILNRTARIKWSRLKAGYIIKTFEYDTTSQLELFNRALSALKKAGEPEINYEVELLYLPENLSLGDTVRVVDDNGELYLSARLLRLEVSEANNTRMATFGEFLIKTSGISEQVRQLSEEFSKLTPSHTMYTWIAWADDAVGSGISLSSTDKPYIGIATNKFASTPDITDASIYTWTRIEGIDGQDGRDGEDGAPGTDGVNGTSIRNKGAWAASTAYVSNATYLDVVTYNGSSYICKSSHTSGSTFDNSKWDLLAQKGDQGIQGTQGPQGIQGPAGTDGVSSYIHIKYSAVANPTDSQMSEVPNTYIGICVNETVADPTTASSYTWSKFEGTDGTNGQPGAPGTNGQTSYVHFAYATSSDGSEDFSTTSFDGAKYIGVYTDFIQADSTDYTKYTWSLIKGADGEDGQDGQDGYSPTATVSKSGDTATITITDKNGTTTQTVTDGTDGDDGDRGTGIYKVTTAPSSYTTTVGGFTPTYRIALSTVKTQAGVTDVLVGDVIEYSYYHYPVGYVDSSYVYLGARTSIRGATGSRGATWYAGTGITGTSTTETIYPNSGASSAIVNDHYLNTDTQNVYRCTVAGAATAAKWVYEQNIKGDQGTPGTNGTNGSTAYFHVKYSNDGGQTFTGNSGEDPGSYIGTYSDNTATDSTSVSSYTWVKIEGEDGTDGQDGYSPTATVTKSGTTATITITDKNGTTSKTVSDGTDGVSVTNVTSTNNTQDGGTSVVTVTLSDGTAKTFNVKNGNKGSTGDTAEWFYGTALTHTSGTATASVTGAVVGSMYLNTDTSLVYKCTAISGSTMTWTYAGDLTTGVIENIDVGGRNLARNTGVMTSSDWVLQRSTVTDSVLTMTPTTSSANAKYKIDYLPYGIYKNNYFTISFDCREVETGSYGTGPVRVCFMVQLASRVNSLVGSGSDRYQTFNLDSQGTDWHRYSITKKIPDEITLGQESALVDSSYVSFQFVRNASTRPIEIKNIKFERGNIATDWSPAPEDLEIGGRNYLQTVSRIGASGTTSGVTWTLGKGCVTLNGTSTSYSVIISQKCFGGLTLEPGIYSVWTDSDKCCFRIGKGSSATHVYSSEGTFLKSSPYILDVSESDIYYVAPIVKNGVTFSNEVVHFMLEKGNKPSDWTPAPEDVEADIDDAKKVATNYMSSDTTGIMVADLNDGEQTPATATGRNVRITNAAVEVRDGQDVKASFGETVVIGESDTTRVEISSDDTKFYGVDGTLAGQIANGDSQQRALLSNDLYYTNYVSSDISGMSFTTIVDSLKLGTESTIQYVVYIGLEGSPEENYEPSVSRTSASTTQINSVGCPFSIAYTPGAQTSTFVVSFGNIPDYQEIEYIDVEVLGFKLVTTAHYQFGLNNTSSGEQSFAEGSSTTASGNFSHSEGYGTKAIGSYAHAEGCTGSSASGIASHAEGGFTAATASYTHAEGFGTSASVIYSHAEGYYSKAKCDASHAEGNHTEASGYYSHSQNHHTVAYNFAETALGQYNANTKLGVNNPGTYAIYLGNGTDTKRNNALLVDWKGDVYLALDEYEDDGTKDNDLAWGMDALGWMTNDTTPSIFNDAPMLDLKQLLINLVEHYPRYLSAKPTFTVNSTNVTTLTQSVAVADGMVVGSFRAVNKIQFAASTSYIIGTMSPKPSFNAVVFVRCGNVFNIQGWVGASDGGVYIQSASAIAANKTFEGMFIYKPA